jgi:hypothetical protein
VTFPPPADDISGSSIFPVLNNNIIFFVEKKIVLDWGDLFRGQGGKRDKKSQNKRSSESEKEGKTKQNL